MSVNKATITALAQVIGSSLGDANTLSVAYDEVMEHLAMMPNPPLLETTTFAITSGTAQYLCPATGIQIAGLFHENLQLDETYKAEIEAYQLTWRASTGTPQTFYAAEETISTVRLFPIPNAAATGTWLVSSIKTGSIPEYMVLYIVFAMLEKEFAYPSDHQDKEFSALCGQIAIIFGKLIGFL